MTKTNSTDETKTPRWQEITGILPECEETMDRDRRDEGIRKLLKEVERLARIEFSRGDKIPEGERTVLWDPLERICAILSISRVKLSAFSRELTGLRAHELTDRIKAETLPERVQKWVLNSITPELAEMRTQLDCARLGDAKYEAGWIKTLWDRLKILRAGPACAKWAMALGFANPSRLSRACLVAQGMSIEELEGRVLMYIVQKLFESLLKGQPQRTQRAQKGKEQGQNTEKMAVADKTEADRIIKEAADSVVKGCVA